MTEHKMTEQEFFDKLEEINKEEPFVCTSRGTIRQKNTNYCPITAVAGKNFTLPSDCSAAELNFQWHLCSSLLGLEYSFAREIIKAADSYFETSSYKDKLLAAINLSHMKAVPAASCDTSSTS